MLPEIARVIAKISAILILISIGGALCSAVGLVAFGSIYLLWDYIILAAIIAFVGVMIAGHSSAARLPPRRSEF